MITSLYNIIKQSLGFDTFSHSQLIHTLIRAFVIYFLSIILVRFNKRMLGIRTPFNSILFFMWSSIFATAIVNENLFLLIILAVLFLMLLNRLLTMLSFYFSPVERFLKGDASVLVRNGQIEWKAMRKHFITEQELSSALQSQLHTASLKEIKSAILANDGVIKFIKKEQQ